MRLIKIITVCFLITIILGTALFSVTALASGISRNDNQTISSFNISNHLDNNKLDSDNDSDNKADAAKAKSQENKSRHSMDRLPDVSGFSAMPWLGASFIGQMARGGSLTTQIKKYSKEYTIRPYPSDKTLMLTSHNLLLQTNTDCQAQALVLHISKLKAG